MLDAAATNHSPSLSHSPRRLSLSLRRATLNDIIRPEDVAFIVPERQRFPEVVKHLGALGSIRSVDNRTVVRYHFLDTKYFTINITKPLPFIFPAIQLVPSDLYQLTFTGGGSGTEELQVEFDRDWVVVYYAFAHHQQASRYIP
ncbi:MAG: hypothetical protein U0361_11695 [Nitrospiraceae bacterium]